MKAREHRAQIIIFLSPFIVITFAQTFNEQSHEAMRQENLLRYLFVTHHLLRTSMRFNFERNECDVSRSVSVPRLLYAYRGP